MLCMIKKSEAVILSIPYAYGEFYFLSLNTLDRNLYFCREFLTENQLH